MYDLEKSTNSILLLCFFIEFSESLNFEASAAITSGHHQNPPLSNNPPVANAIQPSITRHSEGRRSIHVMNGISGGGGSGNSQKSTGGPMPHVSQWNKTATPPLSNNPPVANATHPSITPHSESRRPIHVMNGISGGGGSGNPQKSTGGLLPHVSEKWNRHSTNLWSGVCSWTNANWRPIDGRLVTDWRQLVNDWILAWNWFALCHRKFWKSETKPRAFFHKIQLLLV